MADKTLNLEMGNLVCRFGGEKVLLDMAEEIVLPALLDERLERRYGNSKYFFYQTKLVKLRKHEGEQLLGVVGRLIKDTTLQREQIFEDGKGLIKDHGSMRSSPSALFLLILNNHRLIYVRETGDAPSKDTFSSTLLSFLRQKHKQYIDSEFERHKRLREDGDRPQPERVTKTDLRDETPRPSLELIPLTSEDSIEAFVKKYDILKTIDISLSDRNDENDNDEFFEALQRRKDAIGSDRSTVRHANAQGLDKTEAVKEITEATAQGNQSVKLAGVDKEGDVLRGNNEQFQLRKPLNELSNVPKTAALQLTDSFLSIVQEGLIKIPKTSVAAAAKLQAILAKHFP